MKAGVVANLAAVAALRACRHRAARRLAVHLVVSEEDGGLGAFGTLRRGHTGDACIITEPTSGTLMTANAGALTFRIEVPGRPPTAAPAMPGSAPSTPTCRSTGRCPAGGRAQRRSRPADGRVPHPLSDRRRAGAGRRLGEQRARPAGGRGADGGAARTRTRRTRGRQLETCVAEACADDPWLRDHPAAVTWSGGQFASGRLPAGHPLLDLVAPRARRRHRRAPAARARRALRQRSAAVRRGGHPDAAVRARRRPARPRAARTGPHHRDRDRHPHSRSGGTARSRLDRPTGYSMAGHPCAG